LAADRESPWLTALARNAGIRRALVLTGNVGDVAWSPDAQAYRPAVETVLRELKRRGFDEVVLWDRQAGERNVSDEVRETLRREAATAGKPEAQGGGEAYDAGESAQPAAHASPGPPDPGDFFSVILHHMTHPGRKRVAFAVDWTHYLFGNANGLSESERQWLLVLSKALRDAPLPMEGDDLEKPANLLVLVCGNSSGLPPVFTQGNPLVQEIAVPLPDRAEREAFLKRTSAQWKLQKPLRPGEVSFQEFVDALEGFALRDLQQMIKLSRQQEKNNPLTAEKLVNLYRYGERISPWEDLKRERLAKLEDSLKTRVIGQEEAVKKVCRMILRAFTGLSGLQHSKRQRTPKGVLFFVGPTGVGKTELAKALASFLFGDEDACQRFDMSEFNHEHSDQRLIGAPPGYVGHEAGGQLTNAVKRKPFSVFLFDEIEKAHGRILDKFLQILEDGRLTDSKGETVSFAETVIVFTSNIGAAEVRADMDPAESRARFVEKVRSHFVGELKRPELLNRIGDNVVPFNFIKNDDFLVAIARAKLEPLRERLREKYRIKDLAFQDEPRALLALVKCVDRSHGGRGVLNEMVARILDPLAEFLFAEEENPEAYAGRTVRVVQAGNRPEFGFELE
jgi:hypothetical protein